MKTAHIADLHHSPERHKKVIRILDQLKEVAPDVSLITNSGENFNNPYNFTEQSGYNELLDKWQEITNIRPVATIRATQGKHERPGMIETLTRVGVKILEPGLRYSLTNGYILDGVDPESELLLFGVPHPHKAQILSDNKKMSRDEANAAVNAAMVQLYDRYGALRAGYSNIPALAVGHGVVRGKNTSEIKALSSEIYSSEADLLKMNCGFYAWGHYHNPIEFELIKGGYLGSFAWDFNETDYKPAITIFDWETMTASRHELDINIKRKIMMHPGDVIPDLTGCDVHLVNNQTEWTEADCKEKGAGLIKVTTEVEKEHKIRSKAVIEAVSYQDKFKAVYLEATDRQLKVSEEFWEADRAEGKVPQKKVITPLSIEIYGSKAFSERMGKDLVKFNLRDYNDLTMLIGPGGHGKSTLIDYISPFSILFLQANSLLSTFELADSYVKQEWDINGKLYRIEKFFKPTLSMPKAEYYAFDESGPILGLNGNRKPFDEWCVKMFGTPRKYATSVLNTQFDDNQAQFMGQPINPSIFQATNIELKGLFHELAGTDLKHLELKCKKQADSFKDAIETEQVKKSGVEENIPDVTISQNELKEAETQSHGTEFNLSAAEGNVISKQILVDSIRKVEKENSEIKAVITSLNTQITSESDKKTTLEMDLAEIGNVNVEAINREIIELEGKKTEYDNKLKELPEIQKRNKDLKLAYDIVVDKRNKDNLEVTAHNSTIKLLEDAKESWKTRKVAAEKRKIEKVTKAETATIETNNAMDQNFELQQKTIKDEVKTLGERIGTGKDMISNIIECPKCGYIDAETVKKKESYEDNLKKLEVEKTDKEVELSGLEPPEHTLIEPDFTEEEKEIAEADIEINKEIPLNQILFPAPEVPKYEDETIPTFDRQKYDNLKDKVSDISEDKITELRTKITETQKRITDLETQIKQQKVSEIDYTPVESLKKAEENVKTIQTELTDCRTNIKLIQARINDINRQRESLVEYDKRIAEYEVDYLFWSDMRDKWGPKGIPARILEHTGPYVDQLANNILSQYYPVYKVHSETTKMDATGKKELEVFQISVINQETGREKPINSLSGEERQFVQIALRSAFREISKQNTLEEWMVLFEDEPDSHVSSDYLNNFWDMIEGETEGRTAICVSHSPEIKHRSTVSVDVRSL